MIRAGRGEELRVLYVAMTRAEEQVILSACVPDPYKTMDAGTDGGSDRLSPLSIRNANSFLDWLLAVRSRAPGIFTVEAVLQEETEQEKEEGVLEDALSAAALADPALWPVSSERMQAFEEGCGWGYPYEAAVNLRRKYSVSELKHKFMEDEESLMLFAEPDAYMTEVSSEQHKYRVAKTSAGAERGTAVHKAMELLDLSLPSDRESAEGFLRRLTEEGKITEETASLVSPHYISDILADPIMVRMRGADTRGELKREARFTVRLPAKAAEPEAPEDETIIIQGVIDACFLEDGEWILLDYKTDRVPQEGGEQMLIGRYRAQLEYYAQALEQITERPVREKIIWSCALRKCIML